MIDGPESTVNWRDVVQTLLLLDWSPEGLSSRHDLRKKVEKEPSEFAALLQEVSQMVHLQLRLSSSRVAEDACRVCSVALKAAENDIYPGKWRGLPAG